MLVFSVTLSDEVGTMRHSQHFWTFLSNHAHVLVCIARDPDVRLRDIADEVGITERAVHRLIADLVEDGFLIVTKEGRRNHYAVNAERPLRHPIENHRTVADLLRLLAERPEQQAAS